jgi:hypothetical protein
MSRNSLYLTGSLLCLLSVSLPAAADDYSTALDDHLEPRVQVGVKGGSERSTLTTEMWAPLAQTSGKVIYTDLRLMGDDDDNREGNFGFGYRQVVKETDSVLGVHGWIDQRRTDNNSTFHQLTLGAESLGNVFDMRMNGYVPLSNSHTILFPNTGSLVPYLAGTGIYYDTNGSLVETPQYGVDAELGYRLPVLQKQLDTLRVYGGVYSFFRDKTDPVNGFRIRTEAVINPALSIGARYQYDDPRGSQGFLEATIRFPFSAKKMYQQKGLYGRLDESPERDIDIVTSAKRDSGLHKPVINNDSGTAQRIIYVDNTAATGGDGSKDHPFNNLTSAQDSLKANDILYIAHGDGTTTNMDQGIVVHQDNVTLIGSGSNFVFDNDKYHASNNTDYTGVTLISATSAPMITNIQPWLDNYTGNAVYVDAANFSISGITTSNANGRGVMVRAENGKNLGVVSIDNMTASNNGINGIHVTASGAGSVIEQVNITNSVTNGNGSYGVFVYANTNGVINNAVVTNIASSSNARGMVLDADTLGSINRATLSNVAANNNSAIGFYIGGANGYLANLELTGLAANNNGSYGIDFISSGTGSITGTSLANSNVLNNGVYGILITSPVVDIDLGGGGQNGIGQNRIFGNTGKDIRISITGGGNISAKNNWWGDASGLQPARYILDAGSTIDSAGFLTADPRP